MSDADLEHIALLAEVDVLVGALGRWVDDCPSWNTARQCRALVKRLLARVETLRFRLETPLVVATYGGTGTGKSSLVNALVGREIAEVGRQRPTTTTPTLLIHPDIDQDSLGLDLNPFLIRTVEAPLLRDIVLVDCPDPDTSEAATAGSNLAMLRSIIPHCDVLLYVSTQQKYRNDRIVTELGDVASGCRLVFVQTHADSDTDIRDDWQRCLQPGFDVPEMYFVDSVRALAEQQEGRLPSGDFRSLLRMLSDQLGTSRRVEIRRANLIDLLHEALTRCRSTYDSALPAVTELQETLDQQRTQIRETLTTQLCDELLVNRNLWERRLLSAVTDAWGFSPFSAVLRFYNGLGAFIASLTFFRARTSAQMAIVGAVQGARWARSRAKAQEAEASLERVAAFGIRDQHLQESRMVVSGHLHSSGIDREEHDDRRDLTVLRKHAAGLEGEFLNDARRAIDEVIEELAERNCGWMTRTWYEVLFLSYMAFLLGRVGYNFFWSSFLGPVLGFTDNPEQLLKIEFYVPALLFLVIWSAVLVTSFTWKLRRGLVSRVRRFAESMAASRLVHGLFPSLETTCQAIQSDSDQLNELLQQTRTFRREIADDSSFLGSRRTDSLTEAGSAPRTETS